MNKLFLFLKKTLACQCALILVLLCGCDAAIHSAHKTNGKTAAYSLKICCNSYYELAFQRVIRTINSVYPDLNITFTDDKNESDILITDHMDSTSAANLAALDDLSDTADFIPELLFRRGEEIIGLPLFLEADGIWIDKLPYLRENADIPYRFSDAVNSSFVKSHPILFEEGFESLYRGFIAPLYISFGGSAADVSSGKLSGVAFDKSLERLRGMTETGILKSSDNPSAAFTAGQTAGRLCSFLDIIKIQQDMPLSSNLVFSPGIACYDNEKINLVICADTLFVTKNADEAAAKLFITQLFSDDNILRLVSDTHLPPAVKVNCKNHSLPEIFRNFYSVLSSTAAETVYITDTRSDSEVSRLNDLIKDICKF